MRQSGGPNPDWILPSQIHLGQSLETGYALNTYQMGKGLLEFIAHTSVSTWRGSENLGCFL